MKHYGDITKIDGAAVETVDIITGGSPCQDLSVAGKRMGMQHSDLGDDETTRSGLFMEQIRIIKEMREHDKLEKLRCGWSDEYIRPRFMVWENVPGAFSSNKREDFRAVLEETARIIDQNAVIPRLEVGQKWSPSGCILGDGWSIAWRVHDAQFWGVPQRRKRIALVADFGGLSAPEILFERKSLSRNPEKSRETRESTTNNSSGCSDSASYTLKIRGGAEFDRYGKRAGKGALIQEELSGTLGVSQDQTLITTKGIAWDGKQICQTLTANNAGGNQRMPDKDNFNAVITFEPGAASHVGGHVNQSVTGDMAKSLNNKATDSDHIPIVYGLDRASFNQGENALYDFAVDKELAQTLVSRGPGGVMTELSDRSVQEITKE